MDVVYGAALLCVLKWLDLEKKADETMEMITLSWNENAATYKKVRK